MRRADTTERFVDALLARYGLRAARWRTVATLDCTVLRIVPTQGPELSLRLYPHTKPALAPIETELAWLTDLAAHGVAVPRPISDREGRAVQTWPDGRHAVLLTWLRGRFLDRGLRPLHLRQTGRLIAHLHASADRLAVAGQHDTATRAADGPDLAAWARNLRPPSRAWPRRAQAAASRAAQQLIEEIATWPRGPESRGLIHGDLHPWNLVYASGEAGAIDFSDCGWGWRALDFASTLQYLQHPLAGNHDHRARYPEMRAQLLEGYAEGRPLWPGAERQIDAMLLARWLNSVEWILDDWPRIDLRPFGPGLLRGVVPILERASA